MRRSRLKTSENPLHWDSPFNPATQGDAEDYITDADYSCGVLTVRYSCGDDQVVDYENLIPLLADIDVEWHERADVTLTWVADDELTLSLAMDGERMVRTLTYQQLRSIM